MRHYSFVALMAVMFLAACTNQKKAATSTNTTVNNNMKANLIDGTWEANYMMNSPKPFAEMYADAKPTITFNSAEGKMSGLTGCNNFTGSFSLNGNKISIPENMAMTRKMCRDMAGEQLFLETLKKVNTYSVTDQGKTLNLIMGDMAVMRLVRK